MKMIKLILLFVSLNIISNSQCNLTQSISVDTDLYATPCQLIESRNFICDEHFVTTEDGYILSIQHLINPVLTSSGLKTTKPVVIQHGLFGSATHWLINSEGGFASNYFEHFDNLTAIEDYLAIEGRNLPYLLANLGYDVWIPNSRGNKFSRNHTILNPDSDPSYWKFSFEEMISYDSPATIDYILRQTGHKTLAWIGHSQGSMIIFGLLSERPEYSGKIEPFIALAPVTMLGHITSPVRYLASIPLLKRFFTFIGGEIAIPEILVNLLADSLCKITGVKGICSSIFFLFNGYDSEQFNSTRLPIYISQGLHGTSWRNLIHFAQNIKSNSFAKFDYGFIGNLRRYGSWKPPKYNLGAIDSQSIILIDSLNDPLADPLDVQSLRESLKVPFTEYIVSSSRFSHLDFLWAKNVYQQAYKPMIKLLKRFT